MSSAIVLASFWEISGLQVNAAIVKEIAPTNKLAIFKVQPRLAKTAGLSKQSNGSRKAEESIEEMRDLIPKIRGDFQDLRGAVDVWKSLLTTQNSSGMQPIVIAAQTIDNFESYGNTLPVVNWPNSGGYMIDPWGDPNAGLFPSLSTTVQADGTYSLELGYNIQSYLGYAGMGHLLPQPDWSAWNGVSFVLWPDGSGRTVQFSFTEPIGSDGVKYFWFADYQMTGTQPVVVYMPWSAFYLVSDVPGSEYGHQMNLSGIIEQSWFVKGAPGPGTFYIDKVELFQTASPLSSTIAIPFGSVTD
ncbi:MAG: hypothetical protein JOZ78_23680 [Chroococcidiopsidaceae cyanobacterium CP_BM_ER_R8_30]|nr:hypothetical protein [Chroococcidiopsidaceae cyanobacterium CP_BM_ER_R8_30]